MRLTRQHPATPEEAALLDEKIRRTEITISLVLRIGVTLSVLIFIVGLVVIFIHPDLSFFANHL